MNERCKILFQVSKRLLVSVAILFFTDLAPAATTLQGKDVLSRRPVPDFNVMVNDDGDWSFRVPDPDLARRQILAAIDGLAGTPVKTYIRCIGVGSDVLYYPTEVASSIGWREEVGKWASFVDNARAGIAAGVDPIRLSGERCRELGIYFFPTVRMNDAHFAREPLTDFRTSEFWIENHERLCLSSSSNRLDFRQKEVREYRLKIIYEAIDRYQDVITGIEMDFGRHPIFFPTGSGLRYADLLTEMIAQVRKKLDEAAVAQGRPFYLIVRVNPTVETCHYSGIDVESWVRSGNVDVIVPAALYDIDYDMNITSFRAFTDFAGVKIYPSVYPRTPKMSHDQPFVKNPTATSYATAADWRPTIEMVRGAILNLNHMGADGYEMFNIRPPFGALGFATQRTCANPASMTMRDRVFTVPTGSPRSNYEPSKQIPLDIKPDQAASVTLYVGQNFNHPNEPVPTYVGLRIGLRNIEKAPQLNVSLNGTVLHTGNTVSNLTRIAAPVHRISSALLEPEGYVQFRITDLSILREGSNSIQIERSGSDGSAAIELSQVHLGVLYDNPFGTLE